jgi:hypothetical protein
MDTSSTPSTPQKAGSKDLAVKLAVSGDWKKAYEENLKLLSENPRDVDTLNRIAHASFKLGKYRKAKGYYQKVLDIDRTNPIAVKNLKRLEALSKSKNKGINSQNASGLSIQDVFIEEAGKTKTVELKNVADKKTISILQPGDAVTLAVKRSKVFVQCTDKTYIGMLPDNIGMRMITFINGGNEYSACIKSVSDKDVTVFIRETKKMSRFRDQPSFIHTSITHSILQDSKQ